MLKYTSIFSERTIKYLSLVLGIMVMSLSGSLFSFASLGTDLKARFGFTSSNINLLAAIGDTAMYVGFLIVGPIYDHYGERWTLITASTLTFLGYGGMYIAYAKAWGGLGFLMVLYCLSGVASTAGYLAALAANMANFSDATSGTVSGVLLAFFGLSATLFSQIKTHAFAGSDEIKANPELKGTMATQNYILFLTIITTAIYVIAAIFMVKVPKVPVNSLESGSSSTTTLDNNVHEEQESEKSTTSKAPHPLSRNTTFTPSMHDGQETARNSWDQTISTLDKVPRSKDSVRHVPGELILEDATPAKLVAAPATTDASKMNVNPYLASVDMRPREILVQSTFWFFVIAQVSQQGFSYINNIDSIIHALLNPLDPNTAARASSLTGTHLTLISVGNCLGRLASGIISDWVIARYRISRSIFFFGSEVVILVPLLMMGFSTPIVSMAGLIVSSCLIGATYGATGALFASMTRDFFGSKYYGSACGMVMVLNGANPFIATQLYGVFYDRAAAKMPPMIQEDGSSGDHQNCIGKSCYDTSFKIASLLQLIQSSL
ncbi:hypothetical protein BGZ76_002438 [Entomortierella beljakovae]|nr:hypothetical protein BGZ76_002438 [Entomortierella beljakovae]